MRRRVIIWIALFLMSLDVDSGHTEAYAMKPAQVDQNVLGVIFSGSEHLHYSVTWNSGVKIGDIHMTIQRQPVQTNPTRMDNAAKNAVENFTENYEISAKIISTGPLELLYPVDDTFVCLVAGPMKLPYAYTVHQKEGFGRETHRRTRYDQANRLVWYQKNKEPEQQFTLTGPAYNEFASFIITRGLMFRAEEAIIVPTFADKKRHEFKVSVIRREKRATLFGDKQTLVVQPKMQFRGLYEKSGNTTLWITDDRCRVPVEIHSKLAIGALVAELTGYSNPACPEAMARRHGR